MSPRLRRPTIHLPAPIRAAVRSAVRSSVTRPVEAQKAAGELRRGLWPAVLAEIRWAFRPPRAWLAGVAVNLVLSSFWLLVQPVRHEVHRDWVVLIGTYFSSFILADVTTTNVLGVDNIRVEKSLADGTSLWRLLFVKNAALLVIVGLPTLLFAIALTLWLERPGRLAVTIPDVAVPILSWLGVGNLISVLLPIGYEPLIRRWRRRREVGRTALWLIHLALPYALFYLADPVYGMPQVIFWRHVPAVLGPALGREGGRGVIHIGGALLVWLIGTTLAALLFRVRGLRVK